MHSDAFGWHGHFLDFRCRQEMIVGAFSFGKSRRRDRFYRRLNPICGAPTSIVTALRG
jgi:hypothetical protein